VEPQVRSSSQKAIIWRLAALKTLPVPPVSISTLSRLEIVLPQLFDSIYPQVLTHGDLSKTNILVNSETYEITGIVDWSLATVQPFGMELDSLFLMTGCMDLRGWHDYDCRPRLWEVFWAEFWDATGIDDGGRERIRAQAEAAAQIGALLHYAFSRNADGSPSEVPTESETMLSMPKAWLGD
jgi:Phosphotransferase enzyme family